MKYRLWKLGKTIGGLYGERIIKLSGHLEDEIMKRPLYEDKLREASNRGIKPGYLRWVGDRLANNEPLDEIISLINKMISFKEKINSDLYAYKSLGELRGAIEEAGESLSKKKENIRNEIKSDIVYKDDLYLVVHPKNREASIYYGKGTRWCVAASVSENYFNSYAGQGVFLYYIIKKGANESDIMSKIAFALKKNVNDNRGYISELGYNGEIFNSDDGAIGISDVRSALGSHFDRIMNAIKVNIAKYPITELQQTIKDMTVEKAKLLDWNKDGDIIVEILNSSTNPDILSTLYFENINKLDNNNKFDNNSNNFIILASNKNLPNIILEDLLMNINKSYYSDLLLERIIDNNPSSDKLDLLLKYPAALKILSGTPSLFSRGDSNASPKLLNAVFDNIVKYYSYDRQLVRRLIERLSESRNIDDTLYLKLKEYTYENFYSFKHFDFRTNNNISMDLIKSLSLDKFNDHSENFKVRDSKINQQHIYVSFVNSLRPFIDNIKRKLKDNAFSNKDEYVSAYKYIYLLLEKFRTQFADINPPELDKKYTIYDENDLYDSYNYDEYLNKYLNEISNEISNLSIGTV